MNISSRTLLIVAIALALVLYDLYQGIAYNRAAIAMNYADFAKYASGDTTQGKEHGAQILANTRAMDKYMYFYA